MIKLHWVVDELNFIMTSRYMKVIWFKIAKFLTFTSGTKYSHLLLSTTSNEKCWRSHLGMDLLLNTKHKNRGQHEFCEFEQHFFYFSLWKTNYYGLKYWIIFWSNGPCLHPNSELARLYRNTIEWFLMKYSKLEIIW